MTLFKLKGKFCQTSGFCVSIDESNTEYSVLQDRSDSYSRQYAGWDEVEKLTITSAYENNPSTIGQKCVVVGNQLACPPTPLAEIRDCGKSDHNYQDALGACWYVPEYDNNIIIPEKVPPTITITPENKEKLELILLAGAALLLFFMFKK